MSLNPDAIAQDNHTIVEAVEEAGLGSNGRVNSLNSQPVVEASQYLTDLGNAERFVRQHKDDVRYCSQLGWLVWDGKRWNQDESGEIERRGKLTVRRIYAEAAETEEKDLREKIANHAHRSESAARIGAMIELSRSEKGIPIQQRELDCDPWLLNVRSITQRLCG